MGSTLKGWLPDIVKVLVSVVVATVTATVTATWTVRGMLDDHDKRITINTSIIADLKENQVPRREHEMKWAGQESAMKDMKEDLRDMRTDIKTLLRKQ